MPLKLDACRIKNWDSGCTALTCGLYRLCFQHLLFITCFKTPAPDFTWILHGTAEPICLPSFKGIFAELLKAAKMKSNQMKLKKGLLLLDKTYMSQCFEFRPPLRKMAIKASFAYERGSSLCVLFTHSSHAQ